jgi:acetyl esterase/lipase
MTMGTERSSLLAHGSLVVNATATLNALNAWRAFDRHTNASLPVFAAGWPTSEFPLPTLAAHLAVNGFLARRGAFRGRHGAINGALAAVAAGGLVALEVSARGSGSVYEAALQETLGNDYRSRIAELKHPGPDAAIARTPGAVRMARVRRRFAHDHDLSYGPAGRANLLDVWRREDLPRDGAAPVLIQIPGGAWTIGHKQGQAYPLMSHLAERGWICVAINYRLSPRSRWPAHIVDVKRAIAWVRANIAAYGGDAGFIAVTGGSAGGHLSALAALTPNLAEWQPGFETADTSVAAAVPFYGAYDWTNRDGVGHAGLVPHLEKSVVKAPLAEAFDEYDQASPMSHVGPDAPPFLVSHGVNDALIPVEQARFFVERLRAVSRAPVAYAELPHAQHAFDVFGSPRGTHAAEAASRFLGVVYGDYLRALS